MSDKQELFQTIDKIFNPRSIAVVGITNIKTKPSYRWMSALLKEGFKGKLYPVNRSGGEILGLKVYQGLEEIPDTIDLASIYIPRQGTPALLDECAAKNIKVVHFFTAGFTEIGDELGVKLEEQVLKKIHQHGIRIIGPNSAGIYCPENKIAYGATQILGQSGSVGFVSQSGGIGGKIAETGMARGINYSKGVSVGNAIDLDCADFIEYMAGDPKTTVIGSYIEGTRNGRRLFEVLKETAKVKPLLVWKGGRTEVGCNAAQSHTGSLASQHINWAAAIKQSGAIEVFSLEELTDSLLIFQQLKKWQGSGIGIIGGFVDGGGGICVTASDTLAEHGLRIPRLAIETEKQIGNLIGTVVNILRNPVDISQYQRQPERLRDVIETILNDPNIDLVMMQEDMGMLLQYMSLKDIVNMNDILIDINNSHEKPVVAVLAPGLSEIHRLDAEKKLVDAGIPVFPSIDRAARAIKNLKLYSSLH
jgi:acyl-CoA synthetase (NDP forming)